MEPRYRVRWRHMDKDIAQSDPAEGSRDVVDRELKRQDRREEADKDKPRPDGDRDDKRANKLWDGSR
jgi:hypothetical protein